MTSTIALAGKGGVGKTTIAALIIKYLVNTHSGAVLAIDADPSTNLNMALGMDIGWTVGDIREDLLAQVKTSLLAGGAAMGALPGGVTKRDFLEYQIRSSVEEGDSCDLIAMGRSEGAGCYCAVNHNLREVVDAISKNYAYVVIDNEAGMEHLSRRTTRDVQNLIIVSDPSPRGLVAAERIASFRKELDIHIESCGLIVNRMPPGQELSGVLLEKVQQMDIPLLGVLSADDALAELEITGQAVADLPQTSTTYRQVTEIMHKLGYAG